MDASFRNQGTYNLVQWSDGSSSSYTEPTFSGLVYEYSAWAELESIRTLVHMNNAPSPLIDKTVEDMEVSSKEETEPRKKRVRVGTGFTWTAEDDDALLKGVSKYGLDFERIQEEEVEEVVEEVVVGVFRKAEEETKPRKTKNKNGRGFVWTEEEDKALLKGVDKYGLDWKRIKKEDDGKVFADRTPEALQTHLYDKYPAKYKAVRAVTPRKKTPWKAEEDAALKRGVEVHGNDWDKIQSDNDALKRRTLQALQNRYYKLKNTRSTAPSSTPSATTLGTIADFNEDGPKMKLKAFTQGSNAMSSSKEQRRRVEALTLQIEAQRLQIEEKDASIERKNDIIKKLISVVEEGLGAG
mmetsp:Transcript_13034/g.23899  ORF Transcript_13034/g.23899 Transcript_13034/m.23899 type:complete len:354 (+) Transcript_13034:748-1809(+)